MMETKAGPMERTSQRMIHLALRYAREDGVSLKLEQGVPMGWLTANHETGRSDVAATAYSEAAVTPK